MSILLAGIGLSVALSSGAVLVIRRRCVDVLTNLCHCRQRGAFWATVSCLCMFIVGVSAGLPTVGMTALLEGKYPLLALTTQVKYCLLGLFGSLILISLVVLTCVNRFPPPPRTLSEEMWDRVRQDTGKMQGDGVMMQTSDSESDYEEPRQ